MHLRFIGSVKYLSWVAKKPFLPIWSYHCSSLKYSMYGVILIIWGARSFVITNKLGDQNKAHMSYIMSYALWILIFKKDWIENQSETVRQQPPPWQCETQTKIQSRYKCRFRWLPTRNVIFSAINDLGPRRTATSGTSSYELNVCRDCFYSAPSSSSIPHYHWK